MDWSRNKKETGVGEKSSRIRKTESPSVADERTLKELGEKFNNNTTSLKKETIDIIMKKRGLDNSVNDNNLTRSVEKTKAQEKAEEHLLDNIRYNRTEKGGAEEAKNPLANKEKSADQRDNENRIHRRENRANEAKRVLKRRRIKIPNRLKNKALENVKNNPNAKAKSFERAAVRRASSGVLSFSVKNSKYYKEFQKYMGKKIAKKERLDEKNKVKNFEKTQNRKRLRDFINEKSGRGSKKPVQRVNKRELSYENLRIAREKMSQRTKD